MDTIEITLALPISEHDRFVGWLEEAATGFVQKDAELRAYVPADRWATMDPNRLDARLAAEGYPDALSVRPLAAKNWNAVWEDSLTPVRAGSFLICPTTADLPADHTDATVLRIDPEMSFGTGHHATTRLALQLLPDAEQLAEARVLDVGTGTGVLGIAACRAGAAAALGVDTNPNAVRNARENARKNDVADCVTVREGSVEVVPDEHYDLVTANITRRVLLELLPDLRAHLAPGGTLLLSGILHPHRASILDAAEQHALHRCTTATEDGWWAARFTHQG